MMSGRRRVSCTWTIVSADGIAVSTASWVASASTQSLMIVCDTSGRTASWNRTLHSSVAEGLEGAAGRVVAGAAALDDLGDLVVAAVLDDRAHGIEVARGHQDHDLVDQRGRLRTRRWCAR